MILVMGSRVESKATNENQLNLDQLNLSSLLPFLHSCFSLHPSISPSFPSISPLLPFSSFLFLLPLATIHCGAFYTFLLHGLTLGSSRSCLAGTQVSWFRAFFSSLTGLWVLSQKHFTWCSCLPFKSSPSWFDESYLQQVAKTQCFDDVPGISPNAQLSFGWDDTVGSVTFLCCPDDIALLILNFLSHSWKDWNLFQCLASEEMLSF